MEKKNLFQILFPPPKGHFGAKFSFDICNKGACKYYINALGVGGGSEGYAYFAYVKDQNSYSPENGF